MDIIIQKIVIGTALLTIIFHFGTIVDDNINNMANAAEMISQEQIIIPDPNIYFPDKSKQEKLISWLIKEGISFNVNHLDGSDDVYISWKREYDARVQEAVLKIDKGEDPDSISSKKPKNTSSSIELSVRKEIRRLSSNAFKNENFAELEKQIKIYNEQDLYTPSGQQKISIFSDGLKFVLSPPHGASEDYCFQMEEKVKRWIKNYPESPWAHLTYVAALIEHAGFLRGTDYANTVSKEGWESYYKYHNLVRDYLDKNKSICAKDLEWYAMKIINGKALSLDRQQIYLLVEEALSINSNDYRIYSKTAQYFLPKWHGDAEQLDQFINYAVSKTKGQRGMELYARLYSAASQDQYKHQLFKQSKADWQKMKAGFEDMLKRYPEVWNINIYAHFSCLAGDKEKTQELMNTIGDNPELTVWDSNAEEVFRYCRDWALSH